jgi:hypothetical protein
MRILDRRFHDAPLIIKGSFAVTKMKDEYLDSYI